MKRTPLQRKMPLRAKGAPKPKREPWIKPKAKVVLSRMDCCPEAEERDRLRAELAALRSEITRLAVEVLKS